MKAPESVTSPSVSVMCNVFLCDFQFCWHSVEVDRDMEFVMTVIKTIRSLRSDYNMNKTKADCKITDQASSVVTLTSLFWFQAIYSFSGL